MKTNFKSLRGNNVQKTILRFAAVVISFVLISITVSAQDFWKRLITGSSFNEIALAMVDHSKKADSSFDLTGTSNDFNFVQETDETLQLEPWMLNDTYFSGTVLPIVNESEDPLEIEPWMLNEDLFEVQDSKEELKLESWMISDLVWK